MLQIECMKSRLVFFLFRVVLSSVLSLSLSLIYCLVCPLPPVIMPFYGNVHSLCVRPALVGVRKDSLLHTSFDSVVVLI